MKKDKIGKGASETNPSTEKVKLRNQTYKYQCFAVTGALSQRLKIYNIFFNSDTY